jgi:hypothetical protein
MTSRLNFEMCFPRRLYVYFSLFNGNLTIGNSSWSTGRRLRVQCPLFHFGSKGCFRYDLNLHNARSATSRYAIYVKNDITGCWSIYCSACCVTTTMSVALIELVCRSVISSLRNTANNRVEWPVRGPTLISINNSCHDRVTTSSRMNWWRKQHLCTFLTRSIMRVTSAHEA